MIATVHSAAYLGIQAYPVQIEVDIALGLPQFVVVGLPDVSIKESRERIKAAIKNSGFEFPSDRVTINLAPADIRKEGAAFDLPMAVGILSAMGVLEEEKIRPYLLLGELALDGSLRPVKGGIIIASDLGKNQSLILPKDNAEEAARLSGAKIFAVSHLRDVIGLLSGSQPLEPLLALPWKAQRDASPEDLDFSEVKGQRYAKRALEIAIAGSHNALLIGPPGAGKSMIAKRLPSILPPLEPKEAIEIIKIYNAAGLRPHAEIGQTSRPFRAPHPTSSAVALIGGGTWPKPGEVSLAHHGVLFLDEFPEFRRDAVESLRNPLEDGWVTVSRIRHQITYPCRFLLVAAMNPCPCGFLSDPRRACRCSLGQILRYRNKISGPILDRIDLHIEVPAVTYPVLSDSSSEEGSAAIQARILAARTLQRRRYRGLGFSVNNLMRPRDLKKFAVPDSAGMKLLETAMKELRLSARAYFKILKIARTIADLADSEQIEVSHIAEAIQYRSLDRQWRT